MSIWLETVVTGITGKKFSLSDLLSKDVLKNEDLFPRDICLLEACRNATDESYAPLVEELLDRFSIDVNKVYTYSLRDSKDLGSEFCVDSSHHFYDTTDYVAAPAVDTVKPDTGINWYKDTLLHIAARSGHYHLVQHLVERGANVNITNCCGRTALMQATSHPELVKYLIEVGSDVNAQDRVGHTAAMLCVLRNHPDILSTLLAAGIDVGIADKHGYTIVHHVVRMDNTQCFAALMLSNKVRLQCDSFFVQFQEKPLFYAPMRNFGSSAIALLLSESSDFNLSLEIRAAATVFHKFLDVMGDPQENIAKLEVVESILSHLDDTKIVYCPGVTRYGRREEVVSLEQFRQLLSQVEEAKREVEAIFQGVFKAERVMGRGSFSLVVYLLQAAEYLKREDQSEECLLLIEEATKMLLQRAEQSLLEPRLVNQFGYSIHSLTFPVLVRVPRPQLYTVLFNMARGIVAHLRTVLTLHGHAASRQGSISLHKMIDTNPHMLNYIVRLLNMCHTEICNGNEIFTDIAEFICQQCPTVIIVNFHSSTLLHRVLFQHSDDIHFVSKALEWGACQWINAAGERGNSPLHTTVIKADTSPEILNLLLESGAHVDVTNVDGSTPLQVSASKEHRDILSSYYPLSMKCLAAKTITANTSHIPYNSLDLPKYVKKFIDLHRSQN